MRVALLVTWIDDALHARTGRYDGCGTSGGCGCGSCRGLGVL
ncbi:hypothetical protein ACWDBF_23090 [Streptomyces angustmyceticus]